MQNAEQESLFSIRPSAGIEAAFRSSPLQEVAMRDRISWGDGQKVLGEQKRCVLHQPSSRSRSPSSSRLPCRWWRNHPSAKRMRQPTRRRSLRGAIRTSRAPTPIAMRASFRWSARRRSRGGGSSAPIVLLVLLPRQPDLPADLRRGKSGFQFGVCQPS